MYHKKKRISLSTIFILFLIASIAISNIGTNKKSLNIFGYRPVLVISGSMLPAIQINSISLLQYCSMDDIDVGDIAMYYHPTMRINITHRVIDKYENEYGETVLTTKGDANSGPDSIEIKDSMLVGKLTKTFNSTAPFISLLMTGEKAGEINKPVFVAFILVLALFITLILVGLSFLDNIVRAIYRVVFKKHKVEDAISKLREEREQLNNLEAICANLGRQENDGIGNIISKIILFYYISKTNLQLNDTIETINTVKFISTGEFKKILYNKKDCTDNTVESTEGIADIEGSEVKENNSNI